MKQPRGRPLRFMSMLLALWIGARLVLVTGETGTANQTAQQARATRPPGGKIISTIARAVQLEAEKCCEDRSFQLAAAPLLLLSAGKPMEGERPADWTMAVPSHGPAMIGTTPTASRPALPPIDRDIPAAPPGRSPLSLYAYAFHRDGSASTGVAGTRYGGSQAGVLAGYRIGGSHDAPVELIARATYAPDDPRSVEGGVGLRAQAGRGLSIAAEYRRRVDGTDTLIAYVAGGTQTALPADFTLAAYGQAGGFVQDGVHPFADAQITATRPLARRGKAVLEAGVGSWAGGTDQVQRLDIGPRLAATLPVGPTFLTIAADYRMRVLGDAEPAHGPTLTIAAGL